jgi:hypothetical protein
MKWIVLLAGVSLLSGCMTPEQSAYVRQPRSAAIHASEDSNVNCLGSTLKNCLHVLFDRFDFSNAKSLVDQMNRNDAVDVNGKRVVEKRSLMAVGRLHGMKDSQLVTLQIDYTDAGIVDGMDVGLPRDPALAKTDVEYRESGLYEAFGVVFGDTCASMDRMDLYRFFENNIKPKIGHDGKSVDISMDHVSEDYGSHADVTYCGTRVEYTSGSGNDTNFVTLENPHGAYAMSSIRFSKENPPAI